MSSWTKKITTKRVLLFLLLLIKLAIFPHVGILFIVAAANAASSEPGYRLVIVTEPNKLHRSWKPVGHPDEFYRVVCGLPDAIDWAQKTIFKGRTWHPVKATSVADRDAYTHPHGPCDSKIVGSSRGNTGISLAEYRVRDSADRLCKRISGCALNLDADNEEDYCPTCVWPRENRLN